MPVIYDRSTKATLESNRKSNLSMQTGVRRSAWTGFWLWQEQPVVVVLHIRHGLLNLAFRGVQEGVADNISAPDKAKVIPLNFRDVSLLVEPIGAAGERVVLRGLGAAVEEGACDDLSTIVIRI